MSNRREKADAMGLLDPSPTSTQSTYSRAAFNTLPRSAGSDEPTEFDEEETESTPDSPKEAICSRTSFFVNVDWRFDSTLATATTIVGQMYTERLDPVKKLHQHPIVLIHGDFHTGQLTKPDGNPGWASYFVRRGFQVYLVDMPPCGRSNFLTGGHFYYRDLPQSSHTLSAAAIERDLTAQGKIPIHGGPLTPLKHEKAGFHDKWPGTGQRGDPIFANYCASTVTLHLKKHERQSTGQNALRALLQRIGKAFLVGEGSGGTMCWLATDVEPDLVAGVVAVEPAGPPFGTAISKTNHPRIYTRFIEREKGTRLFGVADIPLSYDPPIHQDVDFEHAGMDPLDVESMMRPDRLGSCFLQKTTTDETVKDPEVVETGPDGNPLTILREPGQARQLIHLKKVPHAIITAHASPHGIYDWATFAFLQQAGVSVDLLQLEAFGILGNGHLMFLETNSDEIASVIERWIMKHAASDSSLERPIPITPESRNVLSSDPIPTTERELSLQTSRSGLPSKNSDGSSEMAPGPLGISPRARYQDQPRVPEPASKLIDLVEVPEVNGKRPLQNSSPPCASRAAESPSVTQNPKRPCIEGVGASTYGVPSTPMQPAPKSFPSLQLIQQYQRVSPQASQSRTYDCYTPPISDLSMLRPSHPGGPSQLRQQMDIIARSDRADRQHGRISLPMLQRSSSNPQGHELYAHLAVDPQLNEQPQTHHMGDVPHVAHTSLGLPQRSFSEDTMENLPEGRWHQLPGDLEPRFGTFGNNCANPVQYQVSQVDRSPADPDLSTPIRQERDPGLGTPITPVISRHANIEDGNEAKFSTFSIKTPPSPSPAPRGPNN